MVNGLDQDRARRRVGPGLGPNYLQRLSADDTRTFRHSVSIMSSLLITSGQTEKRLFYLGQT